MVQPRREIHPPAFLSGGGAAASLIAAFDWRQTPLGPITHWSQTLQATVALILRSPVPIVTLWGPDGIMIYNDAYSGFAGGRHPRLLGSAVRQGWPEVADFNDHVMRVGLAGGTLAYRDQELTLYRNGKPEQVWMNLDYSPIVGADGTPEGVVAIVVETSAKVEAENRLRDSAAAVARLNAELEQRVAERTAERDRVWRNSRDLLVVVGTDGIFRAANPAWTLILGYAPHQVVGHSFLEFVWPEDADLSQAGHAAAIAHQDLTNFENRFRHADGTPRWISWHTSFEGDAVYAYGRDITAEKAQADALRQAEEQLRQAQKMEAVGQLTGGLAHDFNNLLHAISGSLERLDKRMAQGRLDDAGRYIGAARSAAARAAALTHRLLAFSRRQTLDPRPADINRLVADMADLVRRTVGPMVTVELATQEDIWAALVDTNQLESALLNLCINARDAMPEGGTLTIETKNRRFTAAEAAVRELSPGDYVSLCVRDTGTGMTEEVAARAFDPFFTTKPIGMGTGLGLSMIHGFVRQSGGQASIETAPEQGTAVCLFLPRHTGPLMDVIPDRVGAEPAGTMDGEAVLVIDDEATGRRLIAEALDELGYHTLEAENGIAGLEIMRSRARIDLLITDVGLPGGMNGRQVADAARSLRPNLRVLFITGYAESALVGEGQLEPGMHVITKPFPIDSLAARVKALLAG
jgi:PAS domain S-box-containing protein